MKGTNSPKNGNLSNNNGPSPKTGCNNITAFYCVMRLKTRKKVHGRSSAKAIVVQYRHYGRNEMCVNTKTEKYVLARKYIRVNLRTVTCRYTHMDI